MSTSRRDFLKTTAIATGAIAFGGACRGSSQAQSASAPAPKPKRILILGGTGQTGPFQVHYAVSRGHHVTVFNRGRREADLPASVVHLRGDRNTKELDALKGSETWDVVIDNPTTLPHWVRDAGEILKDRTSQYIFISTISVYADTSRPGMDEATTLAKYEGTDALAETMDTFRASQGRLYGPLKAYSEQEAERWFPGKTTVIRPGLIVGPRDETGRFTYWPVRISEGGEVMAPGKPTDKAQYIDGRDLAEWTIRMAERGTTGTYNATGPSSPDTIGGMLEGIRGAVGSDARFTWVDQAFLEEQKVRGWVDMPVWVPQRDENAGFMSVSVQRAVAQGLTYRPLATTARDTLAWYRAQPADQQARLRGPFTREREKEVLAAWHQKKNNS
jgi:2'-hydroxyisoflavone reductase